MAARGTVTKETIISIILKIFPNAFMSLSGKELRINSIEDNSPIQIKVALTAAKDVIDAPNGSRQDGNAPTNDFNRSEPTQEELDEVVRLLEKIGVPHK